MIVKKFLCAPGPTAVPAEILNEMAKPLIHHRTPQFDAIIAENAQLLKQVFKTQNPVVTFTSSGTGAMEASITNFLSKGDKAIVVSAGKFGERFAEIGTAYGVEVIELKAEYGKDVKPAAVAEALKANPGVKAVYSEYSETSTAVAFDIKGIAEVVRKTDAIFVVDAITAAGCMELEMDAWGIDVAVAGSQKSFMIPPGLAFLAASEKARKMMETSNLPKYYFDLAGEIKSNEKNTTSWTPAVTIIIGLNMALKMMVSEGIDNVIKRHYIIAEAIRVGVQAIGLKLFADVPNVRPSDAVTAVRVPDGVEGKKIPDIMQNKYGVTIAGGQGSMAGKIFRLGSLGYMDKTDVIIQLQAMEFTLKDLGFQFESGKSVAAAQKFLLDNIKL
ncbi:MAG: class V aminotransferase [Spirochaetes bacterium GWF1_51_8]|nr:MAG: class V aminotransferase [Spirochaetes bacterium GWF1_51_8]